MTSAGRVLIVPKGAYSKTTEYSLLDLVSYNGAAWLCRQTCISVDPSEDTSEYWFKMSSVATANNLTTETEGYALDARQGKSLNDLITELSESQTLIAADVSALQSEVSGLAAGNVAKDYSTISGYEVGQCVMYNKKLYVCTTKISTPEEFNADHWSECYVMDQVYDLESKALVADGEATETEDAVRDADTLGGLYSASDITEISKNLTALNDSGQVTNFTFDGTNFYVTGKVEGADAVTKKLGSLSAVSTITSGTISSGESTATYTFTKDYDCVYLFCTAEWGSGTHYAKATLTSETAEAVVSLTVENRPTSAVSIGSYLWLNVKSGDKVTISTKYNNGYYAIYGS